MVATVLAGGALAAAGQAALSHAFPLASDGAGVLRLGVQELLGTPPLGTTPRPAPVGAAGAIGATADPRPVDISALVKAMDRYGRTTEVVPQAAAERPSPPVARAAAPQSPGAQPPAAPGPQAVVGDVQMVAGRVTSGFGMRWGRPHRGLDIAAPVGTPIHAPLEGEVIASGPASGFGLWVRVRHDDGTVTTYGHVNRALVRTGQHVVAGEEIAEVGNRGDSTGPHLHVEVETPGGTTVNPRPWLDAHAIGY